MLSQKSAAQIQSKRYGHIYFKKNKNQLNNEFTKPIQPMVRIDKRRMYD